MKESEEICFYCGQSMVTDEDKLFCIIKQEVIENEESTCEEYN